MEKGVPRQVNTCIVTIGAVVKLIHVITSFIKKSGFDLKMITKQQCRPNRVSEIYYSSSGNIQ